MDPRAQNAIFYVTCMPTLESLLICLSSWTSEYLGGSLGEDLSKKVGFFMCMCVIIVIIYPNLDPFLSSKITCL